jgi:acyl transferase domain-containing protein
MSNPHDKEDIAITGMACRFAGSDGLRAYWLRILNGTPAFSDSPDSEAFRFRDPESTQFNRVSTLRGGYLRDLWQTHPGAFGMNAAALAGTNPEHALALDLATQVLKNAGYAEKSLPRERTAVILGYAPYMDPATVNWVQQGLVVDQTLDLARRCFPHGSTLEFEALRKSLQSCLPDYDSRNTTGLIHHTIVTRIAQRFDLQGPAYVVNGESASVHVSLQAAMDEIHSGRADVAIAGGVAGVLSPQLLMPFDHLGYLSRHDVLHPFGREADGTLLGEGGGLFVLKRLTDAQRDGDRIYALVRSVGIAMGGHEKEREEGLAHAIQCCLKQADVAPDSVAMIEAHGSGIPSQDRSEIRALSAVLSEQGRRGAAVAIGSVKALIGHCGVAAGAAGVIKAALGLYHRIIPPAQEALHPHPQLKLAETPFYLNLQSRPWVHNDAGQPRRAGVTALAIGGLSAHAILEQLHGTR